MSDNLTDHIKNNMDSDGYFDWARYNRQQRQANGHKGNINKGLTRDAYTDRGYRDDFASAMSKFTNHDGLRDALCQPEDLEAHDAPRLAQCPSNTSSSIPQWLRNYSG